jgi:hypothetical protein
MEPKTLSTVPYKNMLPGGIFFGHIAKHASNIDSNDYGGAGCDSVKSSFIHHKIKVK